MSYQKGNELFVIKRTNTSIMLLYVMSVHLFKLVSLLIVGYNSPVYGTPSLNKPQLKQIQTGS